MARGSRTLGQLRTEIRELLLETDANNSAWTTDLINSVFNRKKDYREMQLQNVGEGFTITIHDTDIVADQEEYSIPSQGGRLRRILRYVASQNLYIPLEREELNTTPEYTGGIYSDETYIPTYRLIDEYIVLSPPPSVAITSGLRIEMESTSARMTSDNDTLPGSWPLFAETLLVYDTALELLNIEFAQGAPPEGLITTLAQDRALYESRWAEYIARRSFGPIFAEPLNLDVLM